MGAGAEECVDYVIWDHLVITSMIPATPVELLDSLVTLGFWEPGKLRALRHNAVHRGGLRHSIRRGVHALQATLVVIYPINGVERTRRDYSTTKCTVQPYDVGCGHAILDRME